MSADLNDAIKTLLQTKPKPGSAPFALYTPQELITKENLHPNTCWSLGGFRRRVGFQNAANRAATFGCCGAVSFIGV